MSHDTLIRLLRDYGYGFAFVLLLLESVGMPLPGETVMIVASLYAARTHGLAILPLWGACCGGAVMGGAIAYLLGRRVGSRMLCRYGRRVGLTEPRRLLAQYLMQRNGAALVVFSRFIAVLRSLGGLLAGANRMSRGRFMLFNALGGFAWTTLYCIGTYTVGRMAGTAGIVIGVLAAVSLVGGLVFVRRHERSLTLAAMRARDAGMLADLGA